MLTFKKGKYNLKSFNQLKCLLLGIIDYKNLISEDLMNLWIKRCLFKKASIKVHIFNANAERVIRGRKIINRSRSSSLLYCDNKRNFERIKIIIIIILILKLIEFLTSLCIEQQSTK